jgi:glycosyltransferase involved in cell wall biosynthesis
VGAFASRAIYRPVLGALARWDAATARRADRFVANSQYVAQRIARYYKRQATVVYPPVDTDFYRPADMSPSDHVLIVSALVPYKRIEIAVAACAHAGVRLKIAGDGPDRTRLVEQAERASANVEFMGHISDTALRDEYRRARAVLLPGEEDFGIVPVEAQACGTPVIALRRGGATETIVHERTGLLFDEPIAASLAAALARLDQVTFSRAAIRAHAEQFARDRHVRAMQATIDETLAAPPGCRW